MERMSKKGQLTFKLLMTNLFIVRTASGQFVQSLHLPSSSKSQALWVNSNGAKSWLRFTSNSKILDK